MQQARPNAMRVCGVVVALGLTACSRESTAPGTEVAQVVIEPSAATVAVGAQAPLAVTVLDADGLVMHDRPVHWAVEDASILTVSSSGTVTGQVVGATQLSASVGGVSALAHVTVVQAAVASVLVTPDHLSLGLGQSRQLTAEASDAQGNVLTGRPVAWSSNNPSVALVSRTGVVTARAPGGAIITATVEGVSAPAAVTVSFFPFAGR